MKRAIVLKHAEFEGPGSLAAILAGRGYEIDIRSLHEGDPVPLDARREDLIIVMGGPMGVADAQRPELAFLNRELQLLQRRIDEDAPVLGICLGAQLLAHAAGARVYPMSADPNAPRPYEVGWAPIQFHPAPAQSALSGLPAEATVLHWHGDTFDLPQGAQRLASSAICQNQAFRLGRHLFGLQFHCDVDREHVEAFLRADADFVVRANGAGGVAALRAQTDRCIDEARRVGDALLQNLLSAMTAS